MVSENVFEPVGLLTHHVKHLIINMTHAYYMYNNLCMSINTIILLVQTSLYMYTLNT